MEGDQRDGYSSPECNRCRRGNIENAPDDVSKYDTLKVTPRDMLENLSLNSYLNVESGIATISFMLKFQFCFQSLNQEPLNVQNVS